jgi:hypothetical protein
MKRHARLAVVVNVALSLLGAACSGSDDGSSPGGGTANNVPGSGSEENRGDAGDAGDAGGLTQQQRDSCSDVAEQADYQIEQATGTYVYPNDLYTCATDDDCVLFDNSTTCAKECGVVIAATHVAAYAAAIATVNSGICANATGCPVVYTNCGANGVAACYGGSCTYGLPAAWQSFSVEADVGGSGSTLPASCSGTSCTLWTVTPDAKVSVSNGSATVRTATLSSADFATLDGILRSAQLRREETGGISCVLYSGSTHVSESIRRSDLQTGADVSSCVAGMLTADGGATTTNDYLELYNVLKGY